MKDKKISIAEEFKAYDKMWEWLDVKGNPININKTNAQTSSNTGGQQVYIWSVYVPNSAEYPRGNWTSAELNCGVIEGAVFSTPELAETYALKHLRELEDEDELEQFEPDDFVIETIALPASKSGQYIFENSNTVFKFSLLIK